MRGGFDGAGVVISEPTRGLVAIVSTCDPVDAAGRVNSRGRVALAAGESAAETSHTAGRRCRGRRLSRDSLARDRFRMSRQTTVRIPDTQRAE
jgi:hypothetical protein